MLNMDLREEGASMSDFIMFILIGYHVNTIYLRRSGFFEWDEGVIIGRWLEEVDRLRPKGLEWFSEDIGGDMEWTFPH